MASRREDAVRCRAPTLARVETARARLRNGFLDFEFRLRPRPRLHAIRNLLTGARTLVKAVRGFWLKTDRGDFDVGSTRFVKVKPFRNRALRFHFAHPLLDVIVEYELKRGDPFMRKTALVKSRVPGLRLREVGLADFQYSRGGASLVQDAVMLNMGSGGAMITFIESPEQESSAGRRKATHSYKVRAKLGNASWRSQSLVVGALKSPGSPSRS